MDEYDVLQRNDQEDPTPKVDVFIRMGISKLYDIDTANQRFSAEVLIETRWHDAAARSLRDDVPAWRPEIYVENVLNEPKEEIITCKLVWDEDKKRVCVSEIRKVRALFWESLELENFPLDVQDLTVVIASKQSTRHVNFVLMQPEYSRVTVANTLDHSAWQIGNIVRTSTDTIVREYSFGRREYPAVKHTCQAYRLPGYFYWNGVLPLFLISIASLGPFLTDARAAHTRLPATATMLLAAVSYKASVGRTLPTVSYLTSLDKYGLGAVVCIAAMFIYHSVFAMLGELMPSAWAFVVDKTAFVLFVGAIVAKQMIYATWLANVNAYRNKLRDEFKFHESISIDRMKKIN